MISEIASGDFNQKLTNALSGHLSAVLIKNEKIINEIDEIKTVASWYQQAGKNPDQIPSMIVNQCIEKLLETVQKPLSNYLIDRIKVVSEVHSDGLRLKLIEIDFAIKPYVEFVKKVNSIESNTLRISFSIVLAGKLEGVEFHSNYQRRRVEVKIERIIGSLTISIIRASSSMLYTPVMSLTRPVLLYGDEFFKLQNVSFYLSM
jgi:hypothetical protein